MPSVTRCPIAFSALSLLLACGLTGGCVTTPELVGPVALEGLAPAPGATASGTAPEGVTRGPLELADVAVRRDGERHRWEARLHNPSHTTFEVSLVVTLLGPAGVPTGSETRELRLEGGDEARLSGELTAPDSVRFRVEYWVRLLPPPERRIDRIGP